DGVSLGGDEDIFTTKSGLNLQFKGLTAGTDISLSSDANAITINSTASGGGGGGFYGVIFKESPPGTFIEQDDTLVFSSVDFYLLTDEDGKPKVHMQDDIDRVQQRCLDQIP
ncbi:MAG: hypothetical protein ACXABY_22505, partial [Candidatus Thorarchaeota archaeon]